MEVNFVNINGTIFMTSGNWTLRGMSGGILKDSRFMQSFDVKLSGRLSIDWDKTLKDLNQQVSPTYICMVLSMSTEVYVHVCENACMYVRTSMHACILPELQSYLPVYHSGRSIYPRR